jgi:hypothetical protein
MKSEVKSGGWNGSKTRIEDRLADPSDKIPAIVTDTFGLDGLPGGGYVFAPGDIVPLGSHSCLVVSGLEGAATPIDPTDLALLSSCRRLAPIEGHAETIRRQFRLRQTPAHPRALRPAAPSITRGYWMRVVR